MTLQSAKQINQDDDLRRDHYIPIGKRDLVETMVAQGEMQGEQSARFREFASLLESRFHHEFYENLRDLSEAYAAFDPDCIIVDLECQGEATKAEKRETFFKGLKWLLDKANYEQLTRDDINEALSAAKMFGIRLAIDFDAFQHLSVYVRGETFDEWTLRKWYRMFREQKVQVPIYRRLVIVFQYAKDEPEMEESEGEVHLKIFKNIPTTDIDILLPSSKVRLSLIDRGKILLPTVSGISLTAYKIIKTSILATLFTGFYGTIAFLFLIGGTLGYGVKSFFGYLRTKDKYQLNLTRHLYYQNLGNNKGVLFRMLNDAEEQEFREALIAYYLLWKEGQGESWLKEQLDHRAEEWLKEVIGVDVDFEDDDALDKLRRLGLAQVDEGLWQAVPLTEATVRLQSNWQQIAEGTQPMLTDKSEKTTSRTSSD